MKFLKDNAVEVGVVLVAAIILGLAYYNESNKPEPEVPSIQSQMQSAQ